MNDNTNLDVLLEQDSRKDVEIDQSCLRSCLQPGTQVTELQTVTGTSTAVSECHNCAKHKMKFNRLQETYRKLKYRLRKLCEESCQIKQLYNSQVLYSVFTLFTLL